MALPSSDTRGNPTIRLSAPRLSRPFSTATPRLKQAAVPQSASEKEAAPDDLEVLSAEEAEGEEFAIETDLKIPGELQVAPRPNDLPDYVPAESAEDLEWVGGLENWWENDENWGRSKDFVGFGRTEPIVDPTVLEVLARRAVVEALAVRQVAGDQLLVASWQPSRSRHQLLAALAIGVEVLPDGRAELKGNVAPLVEALTSEAEPTDVEDWVPAADEALEFVKSWDRSWKEISLDDPRLKFAVTKRIQQLTGHLLPDSKLLHVDSVSALLKVLVKPPKPKKLVEHIETKGNLTELPNVKVYPRRVTPIDKEKMVGRWKVIVEELEKRDLPVTGSGGYVKGVERKWATGKV
ncbi:hypothetical protein VTK73DRAFT_7861 [Phialemonium thermophilum]|uniref:Large ribosomal subunit protein mL50 n=1 Tax=Phialemonium thermophilum TaxID=223376 RepID=A0ABR3WC87_9PEZI